MSFRFTATRRFPINILPLHMYGLPQSVSILPQSSTFVIIDEPTLTHDYHTRPMAYLGEPSFLACYILWVYTNV